MMKKANLLLAIILLNIICLHAQNYQTVRSGRIALFNNEQANVRSIRIDSVSFDKDSILVPMANIQLLDYNCLTPMGNSWIGKKVVIQNNGFNLFFNNNNDTIRINTLAKVGESWTFFENKDSIKITAEVKSVGIQTILGEIDSVKIIGFKVYDKNGLADKYSFNDATLIFSKNNGFVKILNFSIFPTYLDLVNFEDFEIISLSGFTNPVKGVQNLTWLGVFDFQMGDELHVISNSWNWSGSPGYRNELKTICKFLERKESKDSVFYRIERKESLKKALEKWDNITYSFTHDTITQVYKPDTLFDKLPGEPIILDYSAYAYAMINDGTFIMKYQSDPVITGTLNDSCWHFLFTHGGGPGYYRKGLGGPYYKWNEIISGDERALVYYKKGTTKWGTPLVITDVESIENVDQLNVYPNPATEFVIIENTSGRTEKYILQVVDLQGREVFRNSIELTNSYQLDISYLKEGAYVLKLQNGEKQVSRMIVKKE